MTDDSQTDFTPKPLSETARRALEEAEARRRTREQSPPEVGGRGGLDPVRYGDWEIKGVAADF